MISFFRKIRQKLLEANTVTRYLAYALGEILLVVIGILIALQVNNINNGRLAKIEERRIIEDLSTEIVLAIKSREEIRLEYSTNVKHVAQALDKIYSNLQATFTTEECESIAFSHIIRWDPHTISTLEEIVATGKISLIADIELRNGLVEFRNLSIKNRERLNQTIFEANVLIDDYPLELKRTWIPEIQDSEFTCDIEGIRANDALLARLQSNRGRMTSPINSAKAESDMLKAIQKLINEMSPS